jgi:hypothetical protein
MTLNHLPGARRPLEIKIKSFKFQTMHTRTSQPAAASTGTIKIPKRAQTPKNSAAAPRAAEEAADAVAAEIAALGGAPADAEEESEGQANPPASSARARNQDNQARSKERELQAKIAELEQQLADRAQVTRKTD